MATKEQLQALLNEQIEAHTAEIERHNRCKARENELTRELRETKAEAERATRRATELADRLMMAEGEASRLRGHLEGMRYMIRLEKGLEPHEDPMPATEAFAGAFARSLTR